MTTATIRQGDSRAVLAEMPANSVQCCITSPPFYRLRDYGVDGQIGLEASIAEYIEALVDVFHQVKRVLRPDGTLWVEMGDCYSGGRGGGGIGDEHGQREKGPITELGPKQLLGIPWRLAFALQADGWVLRQEIIWHKVNCLPESVQDRPTRAHTTVFLLSKQARYFFDGDAIREQAGDWAGSDTRESVERGGFNGKTAGIPGREAFRAVTTTRNKRSVWPIPTAPFTGGHFATFPPGLVEPMIRAGTSERGCCPVCGKPWGREIETTGGRGKSWHEHVDDEIRGNHGAPMPKGWARITTGWRQACECEPSEPVPCTVLDPFAGAGTTLLVANRLGRDAIGIELNPEYVAIAERQIREDAPLLNHECVEATP
jgi:DNA modification methylase